MMIVMTIRIRIVSSIVVCGCGFRRLFVSCKTYQLNELTEELNAWSFNNFFSDLCIAYSLFESKAENFYKYSARVFFWQHQSRILCNASRLTVCWGGFSLIVTSWLMPSLVATRMCGTLVISYTSGFITTAVKFRLRVASLWNEKMRKIITKAVTD